MKKISKTKIKMANDLVTKYRDMLRLNNYIITVITNFVPHESNPMTMGTCQTDHQYLVATIELYPLAFRDEVTLKEVIKHEVSHILTEPLSELCDNLHSGVLVTPREIQVETERLTETISRLFD